MNEQFRNYAFGRAFTLHLSEKLIAELAALCKGDEIAGLGLGAAANALLRRGLITWESDGQSRRVRPTKAGLLVYQLMVEAGEYAALEARRLEVIEAEHRFEQEEWDRRFGDVQIKLKDRHSRDASSRPQ